MKNLFSIGCALVAFPFASLAQSLPSSTTKLPERAQLPFTNNFIEYQAQRRQNTTKPATSFKKAQLNSSSARTTADPCNLLPNPSFEDQNVSPLSGSRFNIFSSVTQYDELTGWQSTNGSTPDYFATNAPQGSDSHPSSTSIGSFIPHNFDSSLHNGTVGLYVLHVNTDNSNDQEYITPRAGSIALTQGAYYAAFYAYRTTRISSTNAYKLGMNLTLDDPRTPNQGTVFTKSSSLNIESGNYLTSSSWEPVTGIINNVSTGNYFVNIGNMSPTSSLNGAGLTYYLIDDVALYKIPTAGGNQTNTCINSIVIGEGCPIPGATYTWSAPGVSGLPTNSTNIQITVNSSNTYTLTVNLPNGSTSVSSAVISIGSTPPPAPTVIYLGQDQCLHQAYYSITNYNSNFTYMVNTAYSSPSGVTAVPAQPLTANFRVKASFNADAGSFTITATDNRCPSKTASTTSQEYYIEWQCNDDTFSSAKTTNAYPNPAVESLTLPQGTQSATLLNDQGQPIRQIDKAGSVDVRKLPDGLYNLQMMQNGKLINQRIQVKH